MEVLIPIVLIALGLALVATEIYLVPGFNVVGLLGFLVIIFGVGYTFSVHGTASGMLALVGTLCLAGGMGYWMWYSGAWEHFVLAANLRAEEGTVRRDSDNRARYLGKEGVALTPLRPTGVAEIDGERVEVVTEGEFVAAKSRVRVVAMDRRHFFVRLADALPPAEQDLGVGNRQAGLR